MCTGGQGIPPSSPSPCSVRSGPILCSRSGGGRANNWPLMLRNQRPVLRSWDRSVLPSTRGRPVRLGVSAYGRGSSSAAGTEGTTAGTALALHRAAGAAALAAGQHWRHAGRLSRVHGSGPDPVLLAAFLVGELGLALQADDRFDVVGVPDRGFRPGRTRTRRPTDNRRSSGRPPEPPWPALRVSPARGRVGSWGGRYPGARSTAARTHQARGGLSLRFRHRDRVRSCPPSRECRRRARSAGTRCPSGWLPGVRGA